MAKGERERGNARQSLKERGGCRIQGKGGEEEKRRPPLQKGALAAV